MIGYCVALLIEFGEGWFGKEAPVGAVLPNMAVFGAVIAYIMQMIAFVRLRKRFPTIERPYVCPLGKAGAIVAGVIALITLYVLFLNPDYRLGVYGCAVWYAAGLLYFWLIGRKKLVYSPEEEFCRETFVPGQRLIAGSSSPRKHSLLILLQDSPATLILWTSSGPS